MLTTLALALTLAQVDLPQMALPLMQFTPLQMADGSQRWRLVTQWPIKHLKKNDDPDQVIRDFIAQGMAKALWCPQGWTEESRKVAMQNIVIEGRCMKAGI